MFLLLPVNVSTKNPFAANVLFNLPFIAFKWDVYGGWPVCWWAPTRCPDPLGRRVVWRVQGVITPQETRRHQVYKIFEISWKPGASNFNTLGAKEIDFVFK